MQTLLEQALEHGGSTHSWEDVQRDIDAGDAKLFTADHSGVVVRIDRFPRATVLRVWLAWGDLDELSNGFDALDVLAKEWGCDRIEIEGRRGWERVLKDYRLERVVLTRGS